MFTDILTKEEFENIHQIHVVEGKDSAFKRLALVYEKLILRNNETTQDLAIETTVMNIFKLNKQKKKLKKGYTEIDDFYKRLNDEFEIEKKDHYRNTTSELKDSLLEEIRKIKERETAILQLYAGIFTLVIAIIAIFVSIFA